MADVLMVDDAREVATVTSAVLSRVGHRVRAVESGAAALAELRERAADLMVLDVDMPAMRGWEVLRRVRADPRLVVMRVVVYGNRPPRACPSGVAPDRVVVKGAPIPELVNAVAQLTSRPHAADRSQTPRRRAAAVRRRVRRQRPRR